MVGFFRRLTSSAKECGLDLGSEQELQQPIYTENYPSFGEFDRAALRELIRAAARPGCRMLEIGSWLGAGSTQVFIEELRQCQGMLYCVDTWRGNPNVLPHKEIARQFDVMGTFRHNVRKAGGEDLVRMIAMPSEEAAGILADQQFDLIFIDADHSYQATKTDIAAWRGKVRHGGILCGHDCEARVTDENRERLISARDQDSIPGAGTPFKANHPGVILAVHEAFEDRAKLYAETLLTVDDGRQGRATIWHLKP